MPYELSGIITAIITVGTIEGTAMITAATRPAARRYDPAVDNSTNSADGAELSSMSTVLDDLLQRVADMARRYEDTDREDVSFELYEVERSLRGATRRLDRLTRSL
ncbi:hypothetical protein [Candidatus Poriferisocius sp.]|uniref:hypothetical protein n=1 Tax=Candidatus Poriferisocius sp. TaxID=3101276 RepID=UPI003B5A07D3